MYYIYILKNNKQEKCFKINLENKFRKCLIQRPLYAIRLKNIFYKIFNRENTPHNKQMSKNI